MDTQTSGANVPPPIPLERTRPGRLSFVDRLLDPKTIQWLLGSGAVLLVAGLVVWLASLGVFENPWNVAGGMGVATLALMSGGWTTLKRSRYTLAGRAITLLACLVMPLNLWFYHANSLVTIEGHLWVAALVCCTLYAASALILADALFVYVLVAGIAATGLLILADMHRIAEIASPSVLLMILGLVALHTERAFTTDETKPFSRGRFGKASFLSAQFLVAGSLGLLAGAQITGFLHLPNLMGQLPAIVTDRSLQILAIGVTVLGAYACAYSGLIVKRTISFIYASIALIAWAQLQAIHTLELAKTPHYLILMLAATSAVGHLVAYALRNEPVPGARRAVRQMAMGLSLLPVIYGGYLCVHDLSYIKGDIQLLYTAGSLVVAAAVCRWGARVAKDGVVQSQLCIAGSAVAVLIATSMGLGFQGITGILQQAPWLMSIPTCYMAAAAIRRRHPIADTYRFIANTLTVIVMAGAALSISRGEWLLPMAATCGVAAIGFVLATISKPRGYYSYFASALVMFAVALLLVHAHATNLMAITVLCGIALAHVIAGRLISGSLAGEAQQTGFVLVSLICIGQALFALSRLEMGVANIGTAFSMAVAAAAAALGTMMACGGWKRWLLTLSIAMGLGTMGLLAHLSDLSLLRKLEIFSVAVGLILLVVGHIDWQREQDSQSRSGLATVGLTLGSILTAIPLLIAVVANRFPVGLSLSDELGLLTVGMALFVTGVMFRIRATTLTGAVALSIHLVIIMISAGMRAQLALGVYLSSGGALLFAAGVLLSIYRERLLQIPNRLKAREGIFKVLAWR